MKISRKVTITTLLVIVILPLLALAAVWRLGLLPLLIYHPGGSQSNPLQIIKEMKPGKTPPGMPGGTTTPGGSPGSLSSPPAGSWRIPDSGAKSTLQKEIEARHIARLQRIVGGYEGRLNSLVGEAWNEYTRSREHEKNVSLLALAGKYISSGSALEAQCDAQFYKALSDFEADLRSHNLPTTTARLAQQEYEWVKAARKRQILSAAFQHL